MFLFAAGVIVEERKRSVKLVSPFCKVNLCGALEFLLLLPRKHSSHPSSSKETIEDVAQQHIYRGESRTGGDM